MVEVRTLSGAALEAALTDVARLRIEVFRSYPYLYDGDLDYETRYLEAYRGNDAAILVAAFDGTQLIGASTGTPLEQHADDFAAAFTGAFAGQGIDLNGIFYCAESVLLPAYRGQGIGHAFFDARESHARALGHSHSVFCAVIRPKGHPLRPTDYTPLDGFWHKRGYAPLSDVVAQFRWKDLDQPGETDHPLQFWIRAL